MKETVATEYAVSHATLPAGGRRLDGADLLARSQIVWGEHCSECSYPLCYANCAFYDPRPDLHCRRFEAGIERAAEGITRIRFRKWGKLEGQGPAPLRPWAHAQRREQRDAVVSGVLARAPLPFALARGVVWRWNGSKAVATASRLDPDAFVVEGWSVTGREHAFTLSFLQQAPEPGVFQAHFTLGPQLSRLRVPIASIAAAIKLDQPYLVQIEPVGEAQGVDVAFTLTDFIADTQAAETVGSNVAAMAASAAPLAKVLVWDLDETLWTGVLAEDGPAGVRPRPEALAAIRALDARGVLQSVASKNDPEEGMAALRHHGLADVFLYPQIDWSPKSRSIAHIAARLDLGLDSFVFIDDQPFERAEVQASHPQVRVLPHTAVSDLTSHPWFDHPATPEAARRRSLYQAEAERTTALEVQGGDYLGFLRASQLVLDVRLLGPADVARVHELSQRTNQLNFTGAKLSLGEVEAMASATEDHMRLTLRCADRWGDYGLIGFADLDMARGELAAFFMSCRVQRKRVEHAAFAHMAARLVAAGCSAFRVRFRATERNGAAVRLLEELEFARDGEGWTRSLEQPFAEADLVQVSAPAAAPVVRAA